MQAVQAVPHTHVAKGERDMVTVVRQIGNTTIRVHSPSGFIAMKPEEREAWFREQWERGNPFVRRIVELAFEIEERASAK